MALRVLRVNYEANAQWCLDVILLYEYKADRQAEVPAQRRTPFLFYDRQRVSFLLLHTGRLLIGKYTYDQAHPKYKSCCSLKYKSSYTFLTWPCCFSTRHLLKTKYSSQVAYLDRLLQTLCQTNSQKNSPDWLSLLKCIYQINIGCNQHYWFIFQFCLFTICHYYYYFYFLFSSPRTNNWKCSSKQFQQQQPQLIL